MRSFWILIVVTGFAIVAACVWTGTHQEPVDLRFLSELKPTVEHPDSNSPRMLIRQEEGEIERFLDKSLTSATGWEKKGNGAAITYTLPRRAVTVAVSDMGKDFTQVYVMGRGVLLPTSAQ